MNDELIIKFLKSQFDMTSPDPLYKQLEDGLKAAINHDIITVGDAVPTEKVLTTQLELGQSTVRHALTDLVEEGLIVRRPGRGSFVTNPPVSRTLNSFYGFSSEMAASGLKTTSKVLGFTKTFPNDFIAKKLNIGLDEPIFEIKRLRMVNDDPRALEIANVPCFICPTLTKELAKGSLYKQVEQSTMLKPVEAHEIYDAIVLDSKLAKLLNSNEGAPAFKITRVSKLENSQPFECTYAISPGDRNHYEVTIKSGVVTRPKLS